MKTNKKKHVIRVWILLLYDEVLAKAKKVQKKFVKDRVISGY